MMNDNKSADIWKINEGVWRSPRAWRLHINRSHRRNDLFDHFMISLICKKLLYRFLTILRRGHFLNWLLNNVLTRNWGMVSENDLKQFAHRRVAICQISTFPICQINHINSNTDTLWEKKISWTIICEEWNQQKEMFSIKPINTIW